MTKPMEFTLEAAGPATDEPALVDSLNDEARERVGHDTFHSTTSTKTTLDGKVFITMAFREGNAEPPDDFVPPAG